jgi:Ser/Thr protein kinase RdoA (MazF antagonist)
VGRPLSGPYSRGGPCARFHGSDASLSIEELGRNARDFVLDGDWMPDYLADKYADLTDILLEEVESARKRLARRPTRAHPGDCHRGNILWTDLGPHFVDLDDCVTGPAIQDLWMLLREASRKCARSSPTC